MFALPDYSQAVDHRGEREQAAIEAREAATAARFAELLASDDAICETWATEDEVATTVNPVEALRETDPAKRAEMALAFLDGMAQRCRDRLWQRAAGGAVTPEPQTELVRAARFALSSLDGPMGMVTPGAERRLRKALEAFRWVSA